MRNDEKFEIERAFDLLPHVVGASWATVWFRLNGIRHPTREEFRLKVVEYFKLLDPLLNAYPKEEKFTDITNYITSTSQREIDRILRGKNDEIEKRIKRYMDYG